MDDAARQKATKAMATSTSVLASKSLAAPAESGAARTSTFFTHCLGRRPLIMASTRFLGGFFPWVSSADSAAGVAGVAGGCAASSTATSVASATSDPATSDPTAASGSDPACVSASDSDFSGFSLMSYPSFRCAPRTPHWPQPATFRSITCAVTAPTIAPASTSVG